MTPGLALFASIILALDPPPTPSPAPSPSAVPSPSASAPAFALPTASALASPQAVSTWLGASLGEAPKDVRTQLGKPREIIQSSVGALWHYEVDSGNVTLELVIDQDQVVSIGARVKDGKQSTLADPVGGALGMSSQALQSARGTPIATYDNGDTVAYGEPAGVRWFYSLDSGAVTGISVSKPLPPPQPVQVIADAAHDGSRIDRAFVVKASAQSDATNAELFYLRKLACENGGNWQVNGQELVPAGGRHFDLYHVTCSTTKSARDFYFDVTTSFGK